MITNQLQAIRQVTPVWLALIALALTVGHTRAANSYCTRADCMVLHLRNRTAQPVTFTIETGPCYQGTGCGGACANPNLTVLGPVPPGGTFDMELARVQSSDCDGENGYFSLIPSNRGGEKQSFGFANDGTLWISNIPNRFDGVLSAKSPADGSYTWTFQEVEERLSGPLDERLTKPRNYVAYDSGWWGWVGQDNVNEPGATAIMDTLRFANQAPFWGSHYFSCTGYAAFHPQHVKRLPNKNGRAYFMVAQSRGHNGYIYLIETSPGVLDPVTDLVRPSANGAAVGKIIWQDLYTGAFNGTISPVGNWNHPCKMSLQGGVLLVAAQNWSEGRGIDGCTHSTSNPYQRGASEDAVLFYDVRDPEHPVYWGKMTAAELQLPPFEYLNGTVGSGRGGTARQLSVVSLVRSTTTDEWMLTAGIWKDGVPRFTSWATRSVSPKIEDWTQLLPGGTTWPTLRSITVSEEHGDDFTSYQWNSSRRVTTLANGIERTMRFDTENVGAGGGTRDGFKFNDSPNVGESSEESNKFNMGLPGADRDWDADSIYVTPQGVPVVYTVESAALPDGSRGNSDAYLFQVYDTRNDASRQEPHPVNSVVTTLADSGPGSLRHAIHYGGDITFHPDLNGSTLNLTSGPLVVYLHDVNVDASALSSGIGISVNSNANAPAFKLAGNRTVSTKGFRTQTWATGDPVGWVPGPLGLGHEKALRSGPITHNQQTYVETYVQGPGTLAFAWKVSSERNPISGAGSDFLSFTLDGASRPEVPRIGGEVDWKQQTVSVPAGRHAVRWTYAKDGSDGLGLTKGADAGWVDQVVFSPSANIARGLQAYWNFDGSLADSIQDFHGTRRGTSPVVYGDGKAGFGKALQLDGTDQFVEVTGGEPDALAFASGSVSIAGWFKVGSFDTDWQALVAKGEGTSWRVARRANEAGIAYAGGLTDTPTGKGVSDGSWHHFVAISDDTGAAFGTALYLDGARDAIVAGTPVLAANGRRVMIGANPEALGRQWNGEIDDLAIWNRVLTPEEISILYAAGTGQPVSVFLPSSNADLVSLVPSAGNLSPTFASGTTGYDLTVFNAISSLSLTPTVAQADATLELAYEAVDSAFGLPVASGTATQPVNLKVGKNYIGVQVIAQNGKTVKSYLITVTREPVGNADLAGLVPSLGTLSPAFSSGTTAYTVSVPNDTRSMTLSPTAAQGNAMITILGVPTPSGGSLEFGISPGSEIVDIVVTAQDGTVKTYIVTFLVGPTANVVPVAIAQTLQVELGKPTAITLAGYDPEGRTLFYTLTTLPTNGDLARSIGEPWLTYTPTTLGTGEDSFTFVVNDGTLYGLNRPDSPPATVTILITTGPSLLADVTRPGDVIASLNGAGQSPPTEQVANAIDDSPTTKYLNFGEGSNGVSPFRGITGFTVTPGMGASVVTGLGLTSANDSPERDPASYRLEGSNDGAVFTLIREGAVPAFSARFTRQEFSFANVLGYKMYRLTFPTVLDAERANSMQIAEVELLGRMWIEPPPLSDNADLASLVASTGALIPAFASGTTAYTVTVPNATSTITIRPTAAQSGATLEVNGAPVASDASSGAISLEVGATRIIVAVTAQNGTTVKHYEVIVTREAPEVVVGDVTRPGDVIVSTHPGRSPAAEGVANAIDNDPRTKYLSTGDHSGFFPPYSGITGLIVTPNVGSTVVTRLSLISANDSPQRDPASYRLEGSNDMVTFALIAEGAVPAFSGRSVRRDLAFANPRSYTTYRLTFPTVFNVATAESMQIAEVELIGYASTGQVNSLSIERVDGQILIRFSGILKAAREVKGPYLPVGGPQTTPALIQPDGEAQFFISE